MVGRATSKKLLSRGIKTIDFHQMTFFEKDYGKQRAVGRAIDSIRERFGNGSVFRSAFLNSGVRFSSGGAVDDEGFSVKNAIGKHFLQDIMSKKFS